MRRLVTRIFIPNFAIAKSGFICIVIVSLFITFTELSYCAEDKGEKQQSSQTRKSSSKPILPPIVPSSSVSMIPALSPHISSPDIRPAVISMPMSSVPGVSPSHIHASPSIPARVVIPPVPFQIDIPQVPIIGNVVGRVLDKGTEEDGILWIEVEDKLFNQSLKIKVRSLKDTPIIKQSVRKSFEDIRIGTAVNVIFSNNNQENTANFISILTEEELKLMTGTEKKNQSESLEKIDTLSQE